jgi:protein-disulfide isomerase
MKIRQTYGDKVRIVFKDFPLPNHAQAPKAHEAAHCAGEQGKYWEMHDRIFAFQSTMQVPTLRQHAAELKLDTAAFDKCLDSGKYGLPISIDVKQGQQLGVDSTPTTYVNGRPVIGAQPFEAFKTVIDEELARKR